MKKEAVIIDYGMGNLWSVKSALNFIGVETLVTSDPKKIVSAKILILPGVGAFRRAMTSLNERGISEAIVEAVGRKESKILGICLGMQLLGQSSTENGFTDGLGLITSKSEKFNNDEIIISDEVLNYINENHCNKEDGVRNMKRCLEIIHTKLNLYRLMKPGTNLFEDEMSLKVEFPFVITKNIVDKLIKKEDGSETWRTLYM